MDSLILKHYLPFHIFTLVYTQKNIQPVIFLTLFLCETSSAADYNFASIKGLIEQDVGRLVLPEIYKELDLNIEIHPMSAKRAQLEASSGKKDGEILRIWSYGEENKTTTRVPTSYYQLKTMAFIRKDSEVIINSKEDLKKYRIIKVIGVKHTNNITKGLSNVIDVEDTEKMMKLLRNKRGDVALTSSIDGMVELKKLGFTNIKPISKPLAVLNLYHYIHKKNNYIIPKIDAEIIKIKNSGKLQKFIENAENHVIGNNEL